MIGIVPQLSGECIWLQSVCHGYFALETMASGLKTPDPQVLLQESIEMFSRPSSRLALRWAVDIARGRGGGGTEIKVSPVCLCVWSNRNNDSVLGECLMFPQPPTRAMGRTAGGRRRRMKTKEGNTESRFRDCRGGVVR